MKQPTAPTSRAIKVITGLVFALNAGLYVGAVYERPTLVPALILTGVSVTCYLFWTPVSYDLNGDELRVGFRIGQQRYRPVVNCSPLERLPGMSVRLFGNGGLFAGSGIFWNRQLGVYRAYVTTNVPGSLVLVETGKTKIIISPQDPPEFCDAATEMKKLNPTV